MGLVFDGAAFASGLLTGLREGVEAALIVSIVLTALARGRATVRVDESSEAGARSGADRGYAAGDRGGAAPVWAGVIVAMLASAGAGLLLFATIGQLPAPWEQLFEAVMLIAAAGIVTGMLFWMRRQSARIGSSLRGAVEHALGMPSPRGLFVLGFVVVAREGLETTIFLSSQAVAARSAVEGGPTSVLVGALVGIGMAALIGFGFYRGSRRIDLARFFRWTGVGLVFIAGGLVALAVGELVEIGLVPFGASAAFDVTGVLPDESPLGAILHALFGYSSAPATAALIVQLGYLVAVLALYLRPARVLARA